ncbi:uncharacterized protein LOC124136213 isoform X1 [Haliotis rufescens]|uniref:uncharacterized protein LOC124136213 isoform X1 n=1 Tax=Haliotis rufescens TaxID=6454 RepID=UPI00201ED498|nr:uncharacterized protein LOC124136213 isoform X1 [Haliotis rufescens]
MFVCDGARGRCCLLLLTILVELATASERYSCPEGWLLKQASCYRWGTTAVSHSQATVQCQEWGAGLRVINSEQENSLFTGSLSGSGTNYWLGIDRLGGNGWRVTDHLGQSQELVYNRLSSSYNRRDRNCAVWSSTKAWSTVRCDSAFQFICQKPAECVKNMFGINCSSECHCKGEPCDPTSGICKHGCLLGWSGQSCDTEKLKAEAKFYCFKINGVNEMVFRTNQKNTTYRSVAALDKGGNLITSCDKTIFDYFEAGGLATLKVRKDGDRYEPKCGEIKESDHVVTWRFKFQEFPVTFSAYDVQFEVTCDFTEADTLHRRIASEGEKPPNQTTTLTESKLSVSFDIIDPYKDVPVTTATLGQQVQLQMKLNSEVEYGISAIAPFNCSVSSPDDHHYVLLSDEHGCMTENAQIQFPNTDLLTWRSELFETFAFPGYDKLLFRCQFHTCFDEEHPICHDMCTHSKKRKVRKMRKRRRSHKPRHPVEVGTTLAVKTGNV